MSDFNIFDIAGSGMQAQNVRMNLIASNMANADSVAGSREEAYKAQKPVFKAVMDNAMSHDPLKQAANKVSVSKIIESKQAVLSEYSPNHPLADENGYIYRSNVNPVEEMADMISASRSFQNNIEVINSTKKMMSAVINLGK